MRSPLFHPPSLSPAPSRRPGNPEARTAKRLRAFAFGLCAAIGLASPAQATPAPSASPLARAPRAELQGALAQIRAATARLDHARSAEPAIRKLESQLVERRIRAGAASGSAAADTRRADERIDLELRLHAVSPKTQSLLEDAGLRLTALHRSYRRATGSAPVARLGDIARVDEVASIRLLRRPRFSTGIVTTEADILMGGITARQLGATGNGVRIGILSDSFHAKLTSGTVTGNGCNRKLQGSAPQVLGELPDNIYIFDDGGVASANDEGRAMAELLHDIAPEAELYFHGVSDDADMANGITALVACGVDILVDDFQSPTAPMFQDGIAAQAAQAALDGDVVVVTDANNRGGVGIDEFYIDCDPGDPGNEMHEFANGECTAEFALPPGQTISIMMQWNEPFAIGGSLGAFSDFDLQAFHIEDEGGLTMVAQSATQQGCSLGGQAGDPIEMLEVTNAGIFPEAYAIAITKACGSLTSRLRVSPDPGRSGATFDGAVFAGPQIFGEAAVEGVITVGAMDYREAGLSGGFQPPVEILDAQPTTGHGGNLTIYFDETGTPLGLPDLRFKPDVAGLDCVNTTSWEVDADGDAFPNFCGTSAAAAHVAGIAALMKEADPTLTASTLKSSLASAVVDISIEGTDVVSGSGLVDAASAVFNVMTDILMTVTGGDESILLGSPLTYDVAVANAGPGDATNVQFVMVLPSGLAFLSATLGSCTDTGGLITCPLGDIDAPQQILFSITVDTLAKGTLETFAIVDGQQIDPSAASNLGLVQTLVVPEAHALLGQALGCLTLYACHRRRARR